MFEIRQAKPGEYELVRDFYYKMIDMVEDAEYHPGWIKNVYPEDAYLEESVENGTMYLGWADGQLAGPMIMNHAYNEGYNKITWGVDAKPEEITVFHILAILPTFGGQGYGDAMVQFVIDHGRKTGQKAIRLDVLDYNVPAERLYIKKGFQLRGEQDMYYEDTGWTGFRLYEYLL